ncbi:hypothetical protein A2U01_0115042, partial [Trifolium medium]|nr:hypothetical protein [Trifolium medium]
MENKALQTVQQAQQNKIYIQSYMVLTICNFMEELERVGRLEKQQASK